jgi:hypothetical protein
MELSTFAAPPTWSWSKLGDDETVQLFDALFLQIGEDLPAEAPLPASMSTERFSAVVSRKAPALPAEKQ